MHLPRFLDFARRKKTKADTDPKVTGSAKPPTGEVGAVADAFITALGLSTTNPDQQVQQFGLRKFEEWEIKDCHFRNCLRILKAAVLARELDVEAYSDAPIDQRAAELARFNIENITGRFKRDLREIMDGVSKGYTIHERVWGYIDKGDFTGSAWIGELRHKPPWCYSFVTDRYGRIERLMQETESGGDKHSIPDWQARFLVWAYNANYENPYGRGLMSSCAWPIWFKKNGVKFLNVCCEKFGMPTVKVTMPAQPTPADEAAINKIIDTIQTATGIKVPAGFEVELMEAMRRGGDIYKQLLEWCDREISHAVLGVILATEGTDRGSGSYGLGKSQIVDIFESKIVQDLCEDLEDLLQDQFVKPVIDYNMHIEGYPRIVLRQPKTYAELDARILEILLEHADEDELEIPLRWVKDRWGIPEREEDEPIFKPKKPKPVPPGLDPFAKGKKPGEDGDKKPEDEPDEDELVELTDKPSDAHPAWIVDFTEAVGKREDAYAGAAVAEVNPLIRKAMKGYVDGFRCAFEDGSFEGVQTFLPDMSEVRDLLFRTLYLGNLSGITDGQSMLVKLGWKPTEEHLFTGVADFADIGLGAGIPKPEEALAYFQSLQAVPRDVYMLQSLQGQAFTLAWAEGIAGVKDVQFYLIQALNNGWTFEQFRASLATDAGFMARYMPPQGVNVNAHWDTVFRTNMNWSYNRGRRDFWNDPDVADYVVAYRYNAILDSRVRPEHAAMDGREYAKDSPIWDEWFPPNGYRCRCYVDPVTAREYRADSAKPALARTTDGRTVAVTPDEGFGKRGKVEPSPVRVGV